MKKIFTLLKAAFITLVIAGLVKKPDSIYKNNPKEQNPHEGKQVKFVENPSDPQNADGVCGHLEDMGDTAHTPTFYESVIKRTMDIILSFFGLILLSPVLLILSLWIVIDDPGPILFTQKRVGKDKQFFKLHKFRSMKMNTPHDKPTHMLDNPDQYITNAGRFMRKHSLDLLTSERDKYGANDIKPGLTSWAQINGRDELVIPVKAKLDGEYAEALENDQGLIMDAKCFLGSLGVFKGDESVVEGGTGEMKKQKYEN